MTTMKPCPKCHSTEHLHIKIVYDYLTDDERPGHAQLTREVIEQWNENCDGFWKGLFCHE